MRASRVFVPLVTSALLLAGCSTTDTDEPVVVNQEPGETGEPEETGAPQSIPDTPQAYSALTMIGDESALPAGTDGEVSVVAISEPDGGTSFPFIVHNGTDEPISRIEVSGRAVGPDNATLGTGASQSIEPNFVLPGGYAIGYVYIDTSEYKLPAGSSIPDLRIQFTEGLGDFENIVMLDVKNFEQLASGDLTGDVKNPHDITVDGPISIASACLTADGKVVDQQDFADSDTVPPGGSVTWTISSYGEKPDKCLVRLIGASGYEM